ncbi:amino acid ABC transporter permease [Pseudomonas syringae pv. syringae]|uniref:amino acid ABC transporter permease n=1 Tax=Pseudomonas syringae TaxID=317 RepID=UPI0006B97329|nr:amino acid ABC transporter permease [Pseudomonas syringae]POD19834.1 amino acid ABC transporter permease [Pseudomonas syringae pv. syringae]UQB21775.1 amino acid ABC transporter permease [Pseudomonas syringae pv. syringae]WHN05955.1 amino acid ABC transporter permease [Pseudomonas syringae pv. syringae]
MNTHKTAPQGANSLDRDVSRALASRPYGRWLAWAVVLLILAKFIWLISLNDSFQWPVVGKWLFNPSVLNGLAVTLGLTAVAMVLGIVIGIVLALMRVSDSLLLRNMSGVYIWIFRGTPLLVQLIFWYNLSALFPQITVSIPFGPTLGQWTTNSLITPLTAAIVGLALNEAAYMTEIIRSGLISVDSKQAETAMAFGMTRGRALRRIIIPQAMRTIIPPTGSQVISLIKATSLVSVIAMGDLLYSVQAVYNRTFEIIPMLMVAVAWYLFITSILNVFQRYIERYYARGEHGVSVSNPTHEGLEHRTTVGVEVK